MSGQVRLFQTVSWLLGVFRFEAKGPMRGGKQTATVGYAGTERGAMRTEKPVFLVSALVSRCSCGCCCNSSTNVAWGAKGSSLARRFATVGEKEEKKILKRRNDESGCHCTRPKANLMMQEAVYHKVRRVLPDRTERAKRSTENA